MEGWYRKACCIYCKKEFQIFGKQKWHNCEEARKERTKITNASFRAKYKNRAHISRTGKKKKDVRADWKKCKKCELLTPNYFGYCDSCREKMSQHVDMDMLLSFDIGVFHTEGRRIVTPKSWS